VLSKTFGDVRWLQIRWRHGQRACDSVQVRIDYFGEDVAASYDDDDAEVFASDTVAATADFLADLASEGPAAEDGPSEPSALEFGVGTGRIALPLSERGVLVHGIDLSEAMVARLRAKPGAERVTVTVGDFASATAGRPFRLVYLVYNTIGNLTSQDDQVECFRNAAAHLEPGGHFVIEVGVPDLRRLPPGQTVVPFTVRPGRLGFDEYDVVNQGLVSHHYWETNGQWESMSMPFRYVWPAELDLMARIAGMRLRDRWADWNREPFTAESTKHISVWRK
jgi:SAM-dependent methyltransferase